MDLTQFYGTENYYQTNPLFAPKMVHTDGVQYFADEAGAFWFLDIIATEYVQLMRKHGFLTITLQVTGNKATITVDDGNENVLSVKNIGFTDCPEGEYRFFLTDNVLMLTSEY